jgi:hypothetical protein
MEFHRNWLLWNFIATGFVHVNCCNQGDIKTTPLEGQRVKSGCYISSEADHGDYGPYMV